MMQQFEEPLKTLKHTEEIHAEAKQKQEYKFIGRCKLRNGMRLWAYNPEDKTMLEIQVYKKAVLNISTMKEHSAAEAQYNPKFTYFQSSNETNAWKRLAKYKAGDYSLEEKFDYDPKNFMSIKPY